MKSTDMANIRKQSDRSGIYIYIYIRPGQGVSSQTFVGPAKGRLHRLGCQGPHLGELLHNVIHQILCQIGFGCSPTTPRFTPVALCWADYLRRPPR
jgi:hypothetical protein